MKKQKKLEMNNALYYKIYGVVAAVLVGGLSLTHLLAPDTLYSSSEKRNLETFPALSVGQVADGSFMDGFEDYMADQFPARNLWMGLRTTTDRWMGSVESQKVYIGKDGYLMERFDEPDEALLQRTTNAVNAFAARHADVNMNLLLVPNAVSVNGENLPAHAVTADQNDYIDRFYQAVEPAVTTVDVRKDFERDRSAQQLYYRTDHHWTTDAAFLAYQLVASRMNLFVNGYTPSIVKNDFVGSLVAKSGVNNGSSDNVTIYRPHREETYVVTYDEEQIKTASVYDAPALDGEDAYQVFFGGNHSQITIDTVAETKRKLLIFKDSYANCFIPFLIDNFSKITVIDPRYYYDDIDALMLQNGYTDVLYLYNVNTLSEDNNLYMVLENEQP